MKKRFALLLAAAIMISGCTKPAESPDSTDSVTQKTETALPVETQEETQTETSESGGVPAFTLKPSIPENPVVQGGGVVLAEDRFAEFKELTDFRGEYTTLEESGLEYRFVAYSELGEGVSTYPMNAWDGKLYFRKGKVNSDAPEDGSMPTSYSHAGRPVVELDLESGEMREIPVPEYNGALMYADGEYMVFERNDIMNGVFVGENYQYPVCNGLAFYIIDEDRFFEIDGQETFRVCRIGQAFYYSMVQPATLSDGGTIAIPAIGRVRPSLALNEVVLDYASLEDALADGFYYSQLGGIAFYDLFSGRSIMYEGVSVSDFISASDYLCYVQQRGKSDIFGERFAAGYYPHPQVQKQVILTNYGVNLDYVCVSRSGMYYADLHYTKGSAKQRGILFDTVNSRAVVMPEYTMAYRMCGDWIVFDYYTEDSSEHGYLAVNTAAEE